MGDNIKGCENTKFDTTTKFSMEVQVNNHHADYAELFKAIAMKIVDKNGEIYYHIPYYVKATENEEIFELFMYEQLPDYVKEDLEAINFVKEKREEMKRNDNGLMPEIRKH